jgi:predicted nucleotidyltransferase
MNVEGFIGDLQRWARNKTDIRAIALVGSHARGQARPDSDIDIVMLCLEPSRYLEQTDWTSEFGEITSVSMEDWGKVQSVRVHYRKGLEVEFGLTSTHWAQIPADEGTIKVVKRGVVILLDRDEALTRVTGQVRQSA